MIIATLDTGALIAMERQKQRGLMLLRAAREHRAELLVITPVVTEWWRGSSEVRDRIRRSVTVVPFPARCAEAAGVARGKARGKKVDAKVTIDFMVMAFAAIHGGALVYTSDVGDLQRALAHFPEVRVLGV